MIFFLPGHKHPKLVLEGYDYTINRKRENKTLWKCAFYTKTSCKSRLITSGRAVFITNDQHNHEPKLKESDLTNSVSHIVHIENKNKRTYFCFLFFYIAFLNYCLFFFSYFVFISDVIYFVPGHKNQKLVYKCYDYIVNRRKTNKTLWICASYAKTSCRSRVATSGNTLCVTNVPHNHGLKCSENDLIRVRAMRQVVRVINKVKFP